MVQEQEQTVTSVEEENEALKSQVNKLQDLMQQLLDKAPRQLCKVKMGPIFENGNHYYRVQAEGGGMQIAGYSKEFIFSKGFKGAIKEGTEVIVVAGIIVGFTPEPLTVKEVLPMFDLIGWSEIGGLASQLADIKEAVESPVLHAALAKELGLTPSKGILLYGPPGCGKTLIAKAIASMVIGATRVDAKAFTYVKGGELLSMYIGQTEQRIATMFRNAREYMKVSGKRAVIFIDEAEAILPARGSRKSSDVETTIVPTFLAEMDGFEDENPFVLLATNLPGNLDEAVIREGRIDTKVLIDRPTEADACDIFKIHLGKVKLAEDIDDLAKFGSEKLFRHQVSARASGSLIEAIVNNGIQKVLTRKIADSTTPTGLTQGDIELAIDAL